MGSKPPERFDISVIDAPPSPGAIPPRADPDHINMKAAAIVNAQAINAGTIVLFSMEM